ncbi:hypothetical protein [Tenacibaculum larymnensis]|uniref:Uncharacterized protein n=1 Tax=Tenacibaculum larymnensis TaxID=2878201 RepID=A0A9X4EN05_9FLAO|nr:hypothetical protein [Tenacibaculum larymnensis]MDE1207094.1 hypothetical protein [Tenacibaculum larymnensis]
MLEKIRLFFYCSINAVANYLEVSTDTVKSLSLKRRNYNLQQLDRLIPLYKALELKTSVTELTHATAFIEEEQQNAIPELERLQKKVAKSLRNRQETLQELQKKRAIGLRGLHACTALLHQNNLTVKDTKWITQRKRNLELVLRENNYIKEVKLQSEVTGLQITLEKVLQEIERLKSK